jgi:hypothetical protein
VLFQVSGFSFETFETWRSQLETLKLSDSHLFVFVCKESEKARILIPLFSQNMTEFLFFSFSLSFIFQIILNFADENKQRKSIKSIKFLISFADENSSIKSP